MALASVSAAADHKAIRAMRLLCTWQENRPRRSGGERSMPSAVLYRASEKDSAITNSR
jgi:hypothetical protein